MPSGISSTTAPTSSGIGEQARRSGVSPGALGNREMDNRSRPELKRNGRIQPIPRLSDVAQIDLLHQTASEKLVQIL